MIYVNKLGTQTLKALKELKEPGNEALLTLLTDELEGAKQKLVYANETGKLHRLQGRAEAFEDLLKAINESSKVIEERQETIAFVKHTITGAAYQQDAAKQSWCFKEKENGIAKTSASTAC